VRVPSAESRMAEILGVYYWIGRSSVFGPTVYTSD